MKALAISDHSDSFLTVMMLFSILVPPILGHGRLVDPPARSTMWRLGFDTPVHYNDHQLFCGGYSRQWGKNHGRCGECGDPWDLPRPRPNEAGGIWGTGVISKVYRQGEIIVVTVHLTANHMGWFEFRLCPNNNPKQYVKQSCLNKHVLKLIDYPGTRYELKHSQTGLFRIRLQLPEKVLCSQCVVQWHYTTGNNWGFCKDGSNQPGCGPQEVFRGCSDIAIFAPDDPTYLQFANLTRNSDFSQFLHLNDTPEAEKDGYNNTIIDIIDGPQTNDINITEDLDVDNKKIKDVIDNNNRKVLVNSRQSISKRPSITFVEDKPRQNKGMTTKFHQNSRSKNNFQTVPKKYVSSDDFRKGTNKNRSPQLSAPTPFLPEVEELLEEYKTRIISPKPSSLNQPPVLTTQRKQLSSFPLSKQIHQDEIKPFHPDSFFPEAFEDTALIIPLEGTPSEFGSAVPLSALQQFSGVTSVSGGDIPIAGSPVYAMQTPLTTLQEEDGMQRLLLLQQLLDLVSPSANVPQESAVVLIIS